MKNWESDHWIWPISSGLPRMKAIRGGFMLSDGAKSFMILLSSIQKIWQREKYLLDMMDFKPGCRRFLFILNLFRKMWPWTWVKLMRLSVQSEDGLIHQVIGRICLLIIHCVVLLYIAVEDLIISLSYLHYNDHYSIY